MENATLKALPTAMASPIATAGVMNGQESIDTTIDLEAMPLDELAGALRTAGAREKERWIEYHHRLCQISGLVRNSLYSEAYRLASRNGGARIPVPETMLNILREVGTCLPKKLTDGYAPLQGDGYSNAMMHELDESAKLPVRIASFMVAVMQANARKPHKYLEALCTAQELGLPKEIVAGAQRLYIEKCRPDVARHYT